MALGKPNSLVEAELLGGQPGTLRSQNRSRLLREIRTGSPISRAGLAQVTGLSHPTVSAIVADLLELELIREGAQEQGGIGRPGRLLEFNASRGYVLGVDIGGTRMRAALADMEGTIVAQDERPTTHARGAAVVDQLVELARDLAAGLPGASGRLVAAGIGTPGVFDPRSSRIRLAPNVEGLEDVELADAVSAELGVPVLLDNDVNMAALGERWRGVARDARSFAVIAIGVGVGVGVFVNGELWRGARGAAGEIGYAPIPEATPLSETPQGPLESRLGVGGLRGAAKRLLAERGDASPLRDLDLDAIEAREIFEHAESGDAIARMACEEQAQNATLAVATLSTLLDPELIVLAGGIGTSDYIRREVTERLKRHVPMPPPVLSSGLADAAQLYGAVSVAVDHGLAEFESLMSNQRRS